MGRDDKLSGSIVVAGAASAANSINPIYPTDYATKLAERVFFQSAIIFRRAIRVQLIIINPSV